MWALTQLTALLQPLGLYKLATGSLLDAELAAYACALQAFKDALDDLTDDMLVASATPARLTVWEGLLALPQRPDLPAHHRRRRILYSLSTTPLSFTPVGLQASLMGVGLVVSLQEQFAARQLALTVTAFIGNYPNVYEIIAAARRVLPAHLECQVDVGGLSWQMFEERYENWQALEGEALTWEALDSLLLFNYYEKEDDPYAQHP